MNGNIQNNIVFHEVLEHNEDIIAAIVENLQIERYEDIINHYSILHANLIKLASEIDNFPISDSDAYSALIAFPDEIMRKDILEDLMPHGSRDLPKAPIIPACQVCEDHNVADEICRLEYQHVDPSSRFTQNEREEFIRAVKVLTSRHKQNSLNKQNGKAKRNYRRWHPHEKYTLLIAISQYGFRDTEKIAQVLENRTENQIRNFIAKKFKVDDKILLTKDLLDNPPKGYQPPEKLAHLFTNKDKIWNEKESKTDAQDGQEDSRRAETREASSELRIENGNDLVDTDAQGKVPSSPKEDLEESKFLSGSYLTAKPQGNNWNSLLTIAAGLTFQNGANELGSMHSIEDTKKPSKEFMGSSVVQKIDEAIGSTVLPSVINKPNFLPFVNDNNGMPKLLPSLTPQVYSSLPPPPSGPPPTLSDPLKDIISANYNEARGEDSESDSNFENSKSGIANSRHGDLIPGSDTRYCRSTGSSNPEPMKLMGRRKNSPPPFAKQGLIRLKMQQKKRNSDSSQSDTVQGNNLHDKETQLRNQSNFQKSVVYPEDDNDPQRSIMTPESNNRQQETRGSSLFEAAVISSQRQFDDSTTQSTTKKAKKVRKFLDDSFYRNDSGRLNPKTASKQPESEYIPNYSGDTPVNNNGLIEMMQSSQESPFKFYKDSGLSILYRDDPPSLGFFNENSSFPFETNFDDEDINSKDLFLISDMGNEYSFLKNNK